MIEPREIPPGSLPLFPLGTVLFPGARIPLHLFEPRYLRLAQDLLDLPESERRFGIVAIRRGHEVGADAAAELAPVGCEALVDVIARHHGGSGPMVALVARGGRRFRLDSVLANHPAPYAVGAVTWWDAAVPIDGGAELAAYAMIADVPLSIGDRQRVLEGRTAADRDRIARGLLDREAAIATELRAVHRMARPDRFDLN